MNVIYARITTLEGIESTIQLNCFPHYSRQSYKGFCRSTVAMIYHKIVVVVAELVSLHVYLQILVCDINPCPSQDPMKCVMSQQYKLHFVHTMALSSYKGKGGHRRKSTSR